MTSYRNSQPNTWKSKDINKSMRVDNQYSLLVSAPFFPRPMSPSSQPHGGSSKIRSSNNVFTHKNSGKYNRHGDPVLEILGVSYGGGDD
jgi:hypothetical protein